MTPQISLRIAELRQKQNRGETLSLDELRESTALMRNARGVAASAAPRGGSRTVKTPVDSEALLAGLDGLAGL